jgi:hypothetical protein
VHSPFAELLRALAALFRKLEFRWFLFGAQAAIVHGAARLTADVDVTVDLAGHRIGFLITALDGAGFVPRVEDLKGFAERTRVLPMRHRATAIDLDLVLAGAGPEQRFLRRAVRRTIEGVRVPVVSAEDLIAMKILAGRAKDLEDVAEVVAAQGRSLRVDRVRKTLRSLDQALDRSDLLPAFESAFARVQRPRRKRPPKPARRSTR